MNRKVYEKKLVLFKEKIKLAQFIFFMKSAKIVPDHEPLSITKE